MIDFDKWREIFDSIRRHKLRTFLTALSVFWGIFMLIILLGAGKGLENSATHSFSDDAMNTLWVWGNETSMPYKGLPAGRNVLIENDDYKALKEVEGVGQISSRYFMTGDYFIAYKNKSFAFNVQAVRPEHEYMEKPILISGRFINEKDIAEKRKIVVIGKPVKEEFFKDNYNPIGEYLTIKGVDFKVVGVFEENRESEMRRVYIPVSTAQKIDGTERVNTFIVELGDATYEESKIIEDRIREKLAVQHKFSPKDDNAIGIWSLFDNFQDFQMTIGFINMFIWFVGIGSIVAGVIGVSNIMLIVVKERTKEIGVRKALGATPWSIISMILQEAIFLTTVAGYVGMVAGMTIVFGINYFMQVNGIEAEFFRNPEVSLPVVGTALLILVVSGAIAGLIPALQAVKINPVVAMKS